MFFHVQLFNACGIRDQSDPLVQARNLVDQAASAANLQHSLAALEAVAQKCVLTCSWLLLPTSILCSRCALTKVCVELHAVLTCVGWSAFVEANLKTVATKTSTSSATELLLLRREEAWMALMAVFGSQPFPNPSRGYFFCCEFSFYMFHSYFK